MLRRRKNKTVVRAETSSSSSSKKNNIASKSSVRQRKKEKRYDVRRSPPTKRRTNRLHRSNNISAPVMETPIWLSPLKFSPYVSTTVQKLKRDIFESNVFSGQTAIPKSSTPATLESLFAMSRSQRQRKAFRERFSSKKVNEHNITDMYSELLGEHLKLRQQLRSVLTPEVYNRLLVLRNSEESITSSTPSSSMEMSPPPSPIASSSSTQSFKSIDSSDFGTQVRRKLFDSSMSSSSTDSRSEMYVVLSDFLVIGS